MPEVLEADAISGPQDVICRVVARDTEHLQELVNELLRTPAIRRCTSYIALSRQVPPRTGPLVESAAKRTLSVRRARSSGSCPLLASAPLADAVAPVDRRDVQPGHRRMAHLRLGSGRRRACGPATTGPAGHRNCSSSRKPGHATHQTGTIGRTSAESRQTAISRIEALSCAIIRLVRFFLTRDVEEFAAQAQELLDATIECNVMATVLIGVRSSVYDDAPPLFAYGCDESGVVRAAALRTPPWQMLCSRLERADAATLTGQWLEQDSGLPGVVGLPDTVDAISDEWMRLTGRRARPGLRQAMHVLEQVIAPARIPAGSLRSAGEGDRDLVAAWMRDFVLEAGLGAGERGDVMARAALRRGGLRLWEDGRPVSMIGVQPRVAGVVRVGPVYTPPELRGRGYASAAVAAVSRTALAEGAERCMLFTDLANPTSNKIYAALGYRRIADWDESVFDPVPAT